MHVHQHQLHLLEKHSLAYNIWLAIIGINT